MVIKQETVLIVHTDGEETLLRGEVKVTDDGLVVERKDDIVNVRWEVIRYWAHQKA